MGREMSVEGSNPGRILHDRATRDLLLTEDEQSQLADWYAAQDRVDGIAMPDDGDADSLSLLRAEVSSGVRQLVAAAQRIQELTEQNDTLRREIAVLEQRLVYWLTTSSE